MSDHLHPPPLTHPHFAERPVTVLYLLVLQGLPMLGVLALGIPSYAMFHQPVPWFGMSLTISAVAFCLTYLAGYAWRYRILESLVAPVIWLGLHLFGIL